MNLRKPVNHELWDRITAAIDTGQLHSSLRPSQIDALLEEDKLFLMALYGGSKLWVGWEWQHQGKNAVRSKASDWYCVWEVRT